MIESSGKNIKLDIIKMQIFIYLDPLRRGGFTLMSKVEAVLTKWPHYFRNAGPASDIQIVHIHYFFSVL